MKHTIHDWTQVLHIPHPCIIHIVEYEKYEKHRVKGWFKEYIINKDESNWRFDNDEYMKIAQERELCWVCRWFELKPTWIVKVLSEMESIEERNLPVYYRLSGDWHECDSMNGIDVVLQYPVWINETLFLSEDRELCRQRLNDAFDHLNDERQDHHPYPSPVEDIVDPDLLLYSPPLSATPNTSIRNAYQWIPSKFIVNNETNEVRIASPICHLENRNEIYKDIAMIFSGMLTMFREIKPLGLRDGKTELQVIVKAQSYNMTGGKRNVTFVLCLTLTDQADHIFLIKH
jgi:hypothetical protein